LKKGISPMIRNLLVSSAILVAFSMPSFAATAAANFYVAQDAKSHLCMVSDKKPDGKTMMDAGTKPYASKANAEQAMAALKACAKDAMTKPAAATPAVKPVAVVPAVKTAAVKPVVVAPAKPVAAAPAAMAAGSFYVEQDAKTHKCMVDSKKPDGKMLMDVGTKAYETKGRAEQAMGMLKVCKS
jgi:uncharacterized protein YfcZ (UPF0381/DUF406 family)